MFNIILGLTALVIAGSAAYFSVQGLASLYAGAFISVCIMAGALEIGKLIAASYLHRYWKETSFLLKFYLVISVITLMGITSLGIFGFLTSAYQKSHVKVEMVDLKKQNLQNQKDSFLNEQKTIKERILVLNEVRIKQEQRVMDAGNYKLPREQAYAAIEKSNLEITELQNKNKEYVLKIEQIEKNMLDLKAEESQSTDIGTLRFVADIFNLKIETIVKWFTLLIVFVFDPLAVCLVLAYNNAVYYKKNKTEPKKQEEENNTKKQFVKIETPFNVKYKDK
jgi:cell division protein YceG involved in septum cleavage